MIDLEFFTKFVMPSILGGIAGFFSPWLKHYFDSRSARRDDRRKFIQECRQDLLASDIYFSELNSSDPQPYILTPEASYRRLISRPMFAALKPHFSNAAWQKLCQYDGYTRPGKGKLPITKTTVVTGANENLVRAIISNEIHDLEQRWKLL